jgi:3-methyladenine DNA glycosylase/8-oxoguanine DNA glycosylase
MASPIPRDVALEQDVGMRNAYARIAGVRAGSVTEAEFKAVLDRYRPWQGLAAMYIVSVGWRGGGRWAQSPHALRRR